MEPSQKILFFTNSDCGQANVVLATAHALLRLVPEVEVHIASFPALQRAVQNTSEFARLDSQNALNSRTLVFHSLKGMSWGPASFRPELGIMAANDLTPGWINSATCVARIPSTMIPWSPDEFMTIYREAERVLEQVAPDLVVVEPLFTPGLTLCHHLKSKWIVLAPNTIKDFAIPLQPGLAMLWKYPLICSGMPFPLPWSLIPRNVFLNLVAGYVLLTDNRIKDIAEILRKEVDPQIALITANELGVFKAPPPRLRILVANSPDIDYPFSVLPRHVIPCGPVVRAAPPVSDVDPELAKWLGRGPTIYVNLGTHLKATPAEALKMARALKDVLDLARSSNRKENMAIQVLWKLGRKSEGAELKKDVYDGPWKAVIDRLRSDVDTDTVRMTDWVTAEPKSILESGHVVCSLHHGGASSFYEALCAGVPQVVLPPWSDCYDFANRVELLGIGRWASKVARPRWEQKELASALEGVLFGLEGQIMRNKAREFAVRHPEEEGRMKAAKEIWACLEGCSI